MNKKRRVITTIIATTLLSGLLFSFLVSSSYYYQPVLAQQQNMTGNNDTDATTTGVRDAAGAEFSSPCVQIQTREGGGGGEMTTSGNATTNMNATINNTATATARGEAENQPPTLSVVERIERACQAIQDGDSQDALELLQSALQQLRG